MRKIEVGILASQDQRVRCSLDGVTAIGDFAFRECSGLTSIVIPASVTSIGSGAFARCTGLTSIEIPDGVTTIGDDAFFFCTGLTSVTIYAPSLDYDGKNAFGINADGRKIYVYSNYVDTYRSYASHMSVGWNDIQPIESMSLNDAADNSALITEADGATLDVTLQGRTLTKDGNWNTLCLPFSLSLGQIADEHSPLHDAIIKEMDNTATGTSLDNGTLTLKFNTVYDPTDLSTGSIEAGKPYIVKWTKPDGYDENPGNYNIVNPVFLDVTISDTTSTAIVSNDNHVTFVGQYSPFAIDDSNINSVIMLGAKNTLGYSKNPRQLHSFRAHFEVPTHTGAPAMNSYVIDFGDDETGISLTPDPSPRGEGSEYYTLDGRKLDGKPTKKGMYIVNGRKVVIK